MLKLSKLSLLLIVVHLLHSVKHETATKQNDKSKISPQELRICNPDYIILHMNLYFQYRLAKINLRSFPLPK